MSETPRDRCRRIPRRKATWASSRGWSVDVDDRGTTSGADHDNVTLFISRVALTMDRTFGHVHEVARTRLDHTGAPRPRLHPQRTVDYIDRCLVVGVMVPARSHMRLSSYEPGPQSIDANGLLAGHAWSALAFNPIRRQHKTHQISIVHRGRSSASTCVSRGIV